MEIKAIDIFSHLLPVKNGPYTMSNSTIDQLETIIVRLQTRCGLWGWGETCPLGIAYAGNNAASALASLRQIAPNLVGKDVTDLGKIYKRMNESIAGENYAKAAIDIACHDLSGQKTGQSIAELLGGAKQAYVPSYYAVGLGAPDETIARAKEKLDAGFTKLQLKAGGRDIAMDIEMARKVYESIGQRVKLVIDANRGWSLTDALEFSRACQNIPVILEQPCPTIHDLITLRKTGHHRIYMDENATSLSIVKDAIDQNHIDGFSMKITRIGGLGPMKTFRDICAARAVPHSCDDSWGGDIIAAACVHMGSTVHPDRLEGVWIAENYIEHHYDPENGIKLDRGHIMVPELPGLGLKIDPDRFGSPVFSTR